MTILQMQCFLAVCECRKYSEAAGKLGLLQSALSNQLNSVEKEFSIQLFDKNSQGLQLTEAGNILYPHISYMYGEYKKIIARLHNFPVLIEAHLSLGSMYFLKQYNIIQMIKEFCKANPKINISMSEYRSHELVEMLHTGQLDACFIYKEMLDETYDNIIYIKDDYLYAVVNKEHYLSYRERIHLSELKNEHFILMQGDKRIHKQLRDFCLDEGFVPREYNMDLRNETIKELILHNNCVSLFMGNMADDLIDENLTKILIDENKKLTLCFVIFKDSEACRYFANYIESL